MRQGAFAIVRNPIFTAMIVFAARIGVMAANPLALAAFLILVAAIELQVWVVEEPSSTENGQSKVPVVRQFPRRATQG